MFIFQGITEPDFRYRWPASAFPKKVTEEDEEDDYYFEEEEEEEEELSVGKCLLKIT